MSEHGQESLAVSGTQLAIRHLSAGALPYAVNDVPTFEEQSRNSGEAELPAQVKLGRNRAQMLRRGPTGPKCD